jgi:hypothetical protein
MGCNSSPEVPNSGRRQRRNLEAAAASHGHGQVEAITYRPAFTRPIKETPLMNKSLSKNAPPK